MRNNQQTPESAVAWARWLRDPDRSHNPNAYELIATLLDGLAAQAQEAERVCGEAYQVVGVLLNDLGIFDTERATKVLDNLSAAEQVHKDVLPWPCTPAPDLITIRKPTTRQEVEWLAKIAHLLVKDINQTLDELLAPKEQKDPS